MRWLHFLAFASVLPGQVLSQKLSDFVDQALLDSLKEESLNEMDTCPQAGIIEKRQIGTDLVVAGQIICVGMVAIKQSFPGGSLHSKLQNIKPTKLSLDLKVASKEVQKAYNFLSSAMFQNAAALQVADEVLTDLAVLITSWAADLVYATKAAMGTKPDSGTGGTETTSGCPEPTKLTCGMEGELCGATYEQETEKSVKPICADTEWVGCECTTGLTAHVNSASLFRQAWLTSIGKQLSLLSRKSTECPIEVTDFPAELFDSDKNKIYKHYCQAWNMDTPYNMTVKANGDNTAIEPHLRRKRTPPASTKSYYHWVSKMSFQPTHEGGPCDYNCEEAFQRLRQGCTSNAGGSTMYKRGSLDARCGVFSYELEDRQYQVPDDAKIDCGGSSTCSGPLLNKGHCDHAMKTLRGTDPSSGVFDYSTEKDRLNGNCWGDRAGSGCGVFLQGTNGKQCSASGEKMQTMFDGIRKKCDKCGKIEYEDGCFFKVDFVSGCNNHS